MANKDNKKKNKFKKDSLIFWLVILSILVILWTISGSGGEKTGKMSFSEFMKNVKSDNIKSLTINDDERKITLELKNISNYENEKFTTHFPADYESDLVKILQTKNIEINVDKPSDKSWFNIFISWLPLILIIGFWFYLFRQMQGRGKQAFSFGKSKAKLFTEKEKKVTFKDVAGVKESKEELEEIIEFLKNPRKFQKLGGKIPKGVLLVGPPGSGKTLLARAVAGEAGVPFLSISGSDFVELFVGVGASRVRDLFEQSKKLSPSLIFIDEIDAVGRHRGAGVGGGHDEREQTLNQLLVEMDGFNPNEGIIVMAATNRPDILDPALLRPGRFDRRIVVPTPDVKGREAILKIHTREIPLDEDVRLDIIARSTPGFSGADIANLTNEAALKAAKENRKKVKMVDLEYAKDKVMMGAERKSRIITDHEKKITAYHETGHALLAALIPEADPIHKVTIIPRGVALGLTQQLPTDDRYTLSKKYLDAQITVLLGGRITEQNFMDTLTTGAGNDLQRATSIARKMVCEWGMSSLGPITFGEKDEMVFLGKELSTQKDYSEATSQLIDKEIKSIIEKAYLRGEKIILANKELVKKIAELLLKKESLSSKHMLEIIRKEKGEDAEVNIYKIEIEEKQLKNKNKTKKQTKNKKKEKVKSQSKKIEQQDKKNIEKEDV